MTKEEIQKWSERIDEVSRQIGALTSDLTEEQLNLRPNPNSWSMAQVVEHLTAVSRSYDPIFDRVIAHEYKAPWTSKLPFLAKWVGKMILKSVKPGNPRKTRTFPLWQPEAGNIDRSALDDFNKSQEKLKETMSRIEGNNIIINSPVGANIVYSMEDAFEIIVTHEERHLAQMDRVRRQIKEHAE